MNADILKKRFLNSSNLPNFISTSNQLQSSSNCEQEMLRKENSYFETMNVSKCQTDLSNNLIRPVALRPKKSNIQQVRDQIYSSRQSVFSILPNSVDMTSNSLLFLNNINNSNTNISINLNSNRKSRFVDRRSMFIHHNPVQIIEFNSSIEKKNNPSQNAITNNKNESQSVENIQKISSNVINSNNLAVLRPHLNLIKMKINHFSNNKNQQQLYENYRNLQDLNKIIQTPQSYSSSSSTSSRSSISSISNYDSNNNNNKYDSIENDSIDLDQIEKDLNL